VARLTPISATAVFGLWPSTKRPRSRASCGVSLRSDFSGGRKSRSNSIARRRNPIRKLTPHEARLLGLLVDGHNLKTAAAEIGVTRATVAWHMRSIYEKLQVHSQSEAVAKALRGRMIR